MLARAIATVDHLLHGRLNINIISSDFPGTRSDSRTRYGRSREVIEILQRAWTQDRISYKGEFYQLDLEAAPAKPYQQNGGPLLYFGGISPDAPAAHGRIIDFGLRIHVIIRETEAEARAAADRLISKIDMDQAKIIKGRSVDKTSLGVARQEQLRNSANGLWAEPHLWTGIGLARSGCGSAIVGDPDQVYAKLQRYIDLGFRAFILSGYPHIDECERFAKWVLPRLETCRLAEVQKRLVPNPVTPLTTGPRP
jgi:alkanesulfonate monooxygenase